MSRIITFIMAPAIMAMVQEWFTGILLIRYTTIIVMPNATMTTSMALFPRMLSTSILIFSRIWPSPSPMVLILGALSITVPSR